MATYCKAPQEIVERLTAVMETYHPDLADAAVTLDVLMAYARKNKDGEVTGPALALHGYPCAAVIKVTSYKLRVQGLADATITIDGDRWPDWSEGMKDALLDHELEHLELVTTEEGTKTDDLDRPLLKCKLHDHQFGWFDAIARRHGPASVEVQQANAFAEKRKQLWLPLEGVEQAALKRQRGKGRGKRSKPDADLVKEVGDEFRKAGITAETDGDQVTLTMRGKPRRVKRKDVADVVLEDVRKKFGLRPGKAASTH